MARQSRQDRRLDAIRSVSIQDIVYGRHTRWRRFLRRAKKVAGVFTALAAATAVGSAAYFVLTGSGGSVLVASKPAGALHAHDVPATPLEVPPLAAMASAASDPAPAALPSPSPLPARTVATEIPPPQLGPEAPEEEPVDLARLPTPRPDEPVVTGSIVRADADPADTERRRFRPCRTLQRWTSHLPFPRIHCGS